MPRALRLTYKDMIQLGRSKSTRAAARLPELSLEAIVLESVGIRPKGVSSELAPLEVQPRTHRVFASTQRMNNYCTCVIVLTQAGERFCTADFLTQQQFSHVSQDVV